MKHSREYILPIDGLSLGKHEYKFVLDRAFFAMFEYSEITNGNVEVDLLLHKQESMIELFFKINGELEVACDRCADEFFEPVAGENELILKFGEAFEEETDEILIIPTEQHQFDISHLLYEYTILLLPLRKVHPEDANGNSTCNPEVIEKLNHMNHVESADPRWEALRNLKSKN
ncbi:MAG: DUF177 domain-containing protein [Bacteroidales bacterium]|nr:DUF177 domain-containing protein [Bacteroidales bacterium]